MALSSMVRALVIVDVQPTFCEGGSLAVEGGNQVAADIAALINSDHGYALVVTTQDWHIEPGNHFSNDPDFIDSWPPHGVADSPDAALHPALSNATQHIDRGVRKGQYAAAYSGFEGTTEDGISLLTLLRDAEITNVDVVGLAFDHCVRATALDATKEGFTTKILLGFTASVANDTAAAARVELRGAGVILEQ
ncbi:MAG: isochorismatase family protein [Acidimicrobiales bacterium]|nr:isochorismatase family protein [Acidimicrobiales bacterium]